MAALLNRRRAGSILDDEILLSRPSNSRFLRISSAYQLGAICLHEKSEHNNDRRNTLTSSNNVSVQSNSKFPCFSVGPCQLENKPRETRSAKIKLIKLEDIGRESKSAKINLKLRNITLSTPSLQIKSNDYREDTKFRNNSKLQANSIGRNSHVENISQFQGNHGNSNLNDKNILAHGKQMPPKNKRVCKRIKTSTKRNKSLLKGTRKPRHNSKKSSSKSGTLTHSREDKNNISPKNSFSIMSVVKVTHPCPPKTSLRSNMSKSLPSINSSVSSSPRRMKGDHSKNGQDDSLITSLDESRLGRHKDRSIPYVPRVYLSEKQSRIIMGAPAAPPGTPGLESPEIVWIPSLSDIKSQRLISSKLAGLVLKQTKKENQERMALEQKRLREEKQRLKEMQAKTKQRQRSEIYALNKILTEVENSNYEKFKLEKGLPV